jgi:hypothetical protein
MLHRPDKTPSADCRDGCPGVSRTYPYQKETWHSKSRQTTAKKSLTEWQFRKKNILS